MTQSAPDRSDFEARAARDLARSAGHVTEDSQLPPGDSGAFQGDTRVTRAHRWTRNPSCTCVARGIFGRVHIYKVISKRRRLLNAEETSMLLLQQLADECLHASSSDDDDDSQIYADKFAELFAEPLDVPKGNGYVRNVVSNYSDKHVRSVARQKWQNVMLSPLTVSQQLPPRSIGLLQADQRV